MNIVLCFIFRKRKGKKWGGKRKKKRTASCVGRDVIWVVGGWWLVVGMQPMVPIRESEQV